MPRRRPDNAVSGPVVKQSVYIMDNLGLASLLVWCPWITLKAQVYHKPMKGPVPAIMLADWSDV